MTQDGRAQKRPQGARNRKARFSSPWLVGIAPVLSLGAAMGNCLPPGLSLRTAGELRREILDPCLGAHWQLRTNPAHPEWPGRLVLVDRDSDLRSQPGGVAVSARTQAAMPFGLSAGNGDGLSGRILSSPGAPNPTLPITIRAGDLLTVDQETSVLHARFQAVALEAGRVGQRMRVRLNAGTHSAIGLDGAVVEVIATEPGQAKWLTAKRIEP